MNHVRIEAYIRIESVDRKKKRIFRKKKKKKILKNQSSATWQIGSNKSF